MKILDKIGLTRKITRKNLDNFLKDYQSPARFLDIGCSGGPYIKYFPNRLGVDVKKTPVVDVVADAHDLRVFPDEEFDGILCTEVLEHLHTPSVAIGEMHRVLKKGGTLLLTTRFIFPLHDVPGDYYRFTRYGLEYLLKDFKIIELREEAGTISTLAVLLQRIGWQCETLGCKPLRLGWLLLARVMQLFAPLITKEYGDINHQEQVKQIMTSGYYVACKKI